MTISQPAVGAVTRPSRFRTVAAGSGRDVSDHSSAGAFCLRPASQSGAHDAGSSARPPWWIDPIWVLLLVCLPVLLVTLSEGPAMLGYFKNYVDYYIRDNCLIAVASLLALIGGTIAGKLMKASAAQVQPIDPLRLRQVLRWLGIVALAAYGLLLGPWLLNPYVVWQVLEGGSTDAAKQAMSHLLGVTSLTNLAPLFCAIWSAARLDPRFRITIDLWLIFVGLVLLTLARAFIGSERLALIEFAIPLVLAPAALRWRPSLVRATVPLFGFIGLIVFFAGAEYLRSWRYYQFEVGLDFWEFMLLRLAGYYATALNNGMGMFSIHSPLNFPLFTMSAVSKLPIWPLFDVKNGNVTEDIWAIYLFEIGNGEFNNLSGLFAPLIDFGLRGGLIVMCGIGVVVGHSYRSFAQRRLAGLMLYPTCYIGILEIIRLFYFGESRVVPLLMAAGLVGWFLRNRASRRPGARGGP